MNPLVRGTLNHAKCTGKYCLKRRALDIIQDAKALLFHRNTGCLRFPSTLLTLTTLSINIRVLDIGIPSWVKRQQQVLTFGLGSTGHRQQKFRVLFHLIV